LPKGGVGCVPRGRMEKNDTRNIISDALAVEAEEAKRAGKVKNSPPTPVDYFYRDNFLR